MSSIKQLIINAIIKVSQDSSANQRAEEMSADEARDLFIAALMAELFPEDSVSTATVPMPEQKEDVKPTQEAEKESTPEKEEVPAEVSPSGRKKRAPMTEEQKEAMKAKRAATLAAKKATETATETVVAEAPVVEEKPKKVKREKPASDANLPKIDPTWRKHLKKADKDHAKELEPELLTYLNAMAKEDFNGKSADEHIAEFIASRSKPSDDGKVETDLEVVEFEGKEYYVNPETKRVYEGEGVYDEEVGWTNYKPVGYVGMAAFAEMTLDA